MFGLLLRVDDETDCLNHGMHHILGGLLDRHRLSLCNSHFEVMATLNHKHAGFKAALDSRSDLIGVTL